MTLLSPAAPPAVKAETTVRCVYTAVCPHGRDVTITQTLTKAFTAEESSTLTLDCPDDCTDN